MQIDERVVGDITILSLVGKLTLATGSEEFEEKIRKLVDRQPRKIILYMADCPYMDSPGLGSISRAYTHVLHHGGRLVLLHLSHATKDLLSRTKLLYVFEVFDTEAEALASFATVNR